MNEKTKENWGRIVIASAAIIGTVLILIPFLMAMPNWLAGWLL